MSASPSLVLNNTDESQSYNTMPYPTYSSSNTTTQPSAYAYDLQSQNDNDGGYWNSDTNNKHSRNSKR